jgi:hypothetical protein
VLVVLDTEPSDLIDDGIWPTVYAIVERIQIESCFTGFDITVHETDGETGPAWEDFGRASSVFWFTSGNAYTIAHSVFGTWHQSPLAENPLPSYVEAGGNLFLCGIHPAVSVRFFERSDTRGLARQDYPVVFESTVTDSSWAPHWWASRLGIARVEAWVGNTVAASAAGDRLRIARSRVTGGANPYPDLFFDPLRWPNGPDQRGFGFYDLDVRTRTGVPNPAETIYERDDTGLAVGVRRLTSPGLEGNLVYLGLHPSFVQLPEVQELVRAVLADFGETPAP